jgi:hypothetical protein
MQPIPYELIVDLAEGRVDATEAAALRARVAADPAARAQLASLEALVSLMRDDDSVDAPNHVISRAVRLMRKPAAAPAPSPLQRLIAVLKVDSWQAPALAPGLRSTQVWPRALLLSAGDRDLDLQIGPRGDGWQLTGQVLGPEEQGTVVLSGGGLRLSVPLNELGEFVLPPVGAGRYLLQVTQGAREIVVSDLELGPSSS